MPKAKEPSDSAPSPRTEFTNRLRTYSEDHPDLSSSEVSEAVFQQIHEETPGLIRDYFLREGKLILTWDLRTEWINTRRGVYQTIYLAANGQPEPVTDVEVKRASWFDQIQNWREFDPGDPEHGIPSGDRVFLTLNKPALERSAENDVQRALHHGWKATWKRSLAAGLPNDTTTIEEHYDPEQIRQVMIEAKLKVEKDIKRGDFKLRIKSIGQITFAEPRSERTG